MDLKAPSAQSWGSPKGLCVYCGGVRGQTQTLANALAFIVGAMSWLHWPGTPPVCTNLAIAGRGLVKTL